MPEIGVRTAVRKALAEALRADSVLVSLLPAGSAGVMNEHDVDANTTAFPCLTLHAGAGYHGGGHSTRYQYWDITVYTNEGDTFDPELVFNRVEAKLDHTQIQLDSGCGWALTGLVLVLEAAYGYNPILRVRSITQRYRASLTKFS